MASIQSGELFFALVNGVIVSLVVTAVFLLMYRRAVARTMRTASASGGIPEAASPLATPTVDGGADGPGLDRGIAASDPDRLARVAGRTRRSIAVAYGCAFALSTLLLHAPTLDGLWGESTDGLGLLRALAWWLPVWCSTLFILAALLHLGRRDTWTAVAGALVAGAAFSVLMPTGIRLTTGAPLGPELLVNAGYFAMAFALNGAMPAVLVYLTGRPRLRNVMPLVLVMVMSLSLVVATVYHVFVQLFAGSGPLEPTLARRAAMAIGPSTLVLLLALPAGWLAWRGTARLAERYRARRFSDMQLLADAWWGVIVAFSLAGLWQYGGALALGCTAAAWASYFIVVRVLLRVQGAGAGAGGPSLLLLRVFGHQSRTERLFDVVAARWRFTGPVAMIAGADLALRSIDVDEALAFAHGEIESSYVADREGLQRRLAGLQGRVDPDGRYRVEEFFCFDDTWRATLQALLAHSEVVLMDLRGFTADNTGCRFELEQLGRLGRLQRCVFIADRDTDRALALQALLQGAGTASAPAAHWIDLAVDDDAALRRLRETLWTVAAGR
jgi:hypothetical protein